MVETGWAVIWRPERGPAPGGSAQSGRLRGWRGLKGEFWGCCPVPGRECACASRGAATAGTGGTAPTSSPAAQTQPSGRGSVRASGPPSRLSKSSSQEEDRGRPGDVRCLCGLPEVGEDARDRSTVGDEGDQSQRLPTAGAPQREDLHPGRAKAVQQHAPRVRHRPRSRRLVLCRSRRREARPRRAASRSGTTARGSHPAPPAPRASGLVSPPANIRQTATYPT